MRSSIHPIDNEAAACAFLRVPLLQELSAAVLHCLARAPRRISCARGHRLNHPGEPLDSVCLVLSGTVCRTLVTDRGAERVLDLYGANELCGIAELFGDLEAPIHHVMVEAGHLITLPMADMRAACELSPALMHRMAHHLANRQLALEEELVTCQMQSANDRVLHYLQSHCSTRAHAEGHDSTLQLPASKQLVAARLGMTPESFSRALRELSDKGIILNQGRNIVLRGSSAKARRSRGDALAAPSRERRRTGADPLGSQRHRPAIALINLAGRQRMLSERMAKAWIMAGRRISPDKARRMLRESIAFYERQRERVRAAAGSRLATELQQVESASWLRYRGLLLETPRRERLADLLAANAAVLDVAERTTCELARNEEYLGSLVNLAGQQRMLAQRLAKNFLALPWRGNRKATEDAIQCDLRDFNDGLQRLEDARITNAGSELSKIYPCWRAMEQHVRCGTRAGDEAARAAKVVIHSERLVSDMDLAVASLVGRIERLIDGGSKASALIAA